MSFWSYKSYLAALVPCDGIDCTLCDFFALAQNIFNFVALTLVPVVAVLLIFWGGYMFLISGGNPGGITKAKSILKNTVIGLVIVYAAYLAASYIVSFFAGGGSVAGSSFTSRGFVVQCERVEIPDRTGVEIGSLEERDLITPEPSARFAAEGLGDFIFVGGGTVKYSNGVNINDLEDNVIDGLRQAAVAGSKPEIGIGLVVTSGFRSVDDQMALVARNCVDPDAARCVIKPGGVETCVPRDDGANCRHTTGKAVDVWCWQGGARCPQSTLFQQVMKPNGWCVYNRENWHFELKTDLDRDPERKEFFSC